ncbi:hypothetical protein KEM56_006792 [Ascosphaera pollenicola]|nr:hypothetical protein KEM56_006792 [Ascosphaera pollenicola]
MATKTPATTGVAAGTTPATGVTAGPGTLGASTSGADQQTRGLPYYERLRRDLRETIQKKRLLDKNMAMLEDSIYRFEQSYLEETGAGNIIKGFDNYIKGATIPSSSSTGGAGGGARRKAHVNDADRVFSRSSVSFNRDSPAPGSNTPSHAGTPASSVPPNAGGPSKAGSKKKKAASTAENRDRDSETPKPPVKRLKITYERD